MNKNEKYFKSYYLLKKLAKTFILLLCLDIAFMLIIFSTFIFTNNLTYLFLCGGCIPVALIFSCINTLCERKCDKLHRDFIDFTDDVFPDTKEKMIQKINEQKEIIEVYEYVSTVESEKEEIIPMHLIDTYEKPKIFVKKYK